MGRLMGIETEYGFYVEGRGAADQMMDAMEFIQCFPGRAFHGWDYRFEDPRRDLRGFRVDHLTPDPQDQKFEEERPTRLPDREVRSDRVLPNGARLYNDHGHPEYATPECLSIADLIAHDKAGEQIMRICAHHYMELTERRAILYKNNTDFHGASYGTHENYLLRRSVQYEQLQAGILPFFVTRQVYAGAGKAGVEADRSDSRFQLSQRADFFMETANVETLYRRPIVNTRDEPHAAERDWCRFHVICGDANMSEYAMALKVGCTELALSLIEAGWKPGVVVPDPVKAAQKLSRDETFRWEVSLKDDAVVRATDIQRLYCSAVKSELSGRDAETDWLIAEWADVLDVLDTDPLSLDDRLDWVAKRRLILELMADRNGEWDTAMAHSADLEYHNIEPTEGLHYALEADGRMLRIVSDARIDEAMNFPPSDTRAFIRGTCIRRHLDRIENITWSRLTLRDDTQTVSLDLSRMVVAGMRELNSALAETSDVADFAAHVLQIRNRP